MNFVSAVKSGFAKYADFSSRASRSEYWFFTLFNVLVYLVTNLVDYVVLSGTPVFNLIAMLALLLPGIAVAVRRLHDIERSGRWFLLILVPLVGPIILIYWYCQRGTVGPNQFGADPLPAQSSLAHAPKAA